MKRLKKGLKSTFILLAFASFLLLAGCSLNISTDDQPAEQKENDSLPLDHGNEQPADESGEVKITYRFADQEEGVSLLLGNTDYYNGLNQNDMDYRAQKKGATLEDVKEFVSAQVLEFSEDEKKAIDESISTIESILKENGYVLPQTDEIVFIRTTMHEEGEAEAYTHKTEIYYGDTVMKQLLSDDEATRRAGNCTMCHEIFHCLTRNNPQFRKDMYSIINFTVQDQDFEIGAGPAEISLSNPDVSHHDAYATFTVNGEKKDCFMLLITTQPFEKEGDNFVEFGMPVLVPVDDTNTYYSLGKEIAPNDLLDVVGRNTGYIIDPEECIADNFSYAIMYGKDGIEGQPYETPEIIDEIIDYLKA